MVSEVSESLHIAGKEEKEETPHANPNPTRPDVEKRRENPMLWRSPYDPGHKPFLSFNIPRDIEIERTRTRNRVTSSEKKRKKRDIQRTVLGFQPQDCPFLNFQGGMLSGHQLTFSERRVSTSHPLRGIPDASQRSPFRARSRRRGYRP